MSIFDALLLPKILEISNNTYKNVNDDLKASLERLGKFREECLNSKEKGNKDKTLITTLQSIHEDDGSIILVESKQDKSLNESIRCEQCSLPRFFKGQKGLKIHVSRVHKDISTIIIIKDEPQPTKTSKPNTESDQTSDQDDQTNNNKKRPSKKRSKDEVEGLSSPEQDKRQKRNASVKAQSIISKQMGKKSERQILKELDQEGIAFVSELVNVNLTQKLRREDSTDSKTRRRRKKDDRENDENVVPNIQIKQEKVSIPPEPMDMESLPLDIEVKKEPSKDDIAMPPPVAPVPKPRKGQKEKPSQSEESGEEESTGKRRTTRTRKQTDTMPPPAAPVPSARATRASSRSVRHTQADEMPPPAQPEPRPKRTRAKKKVSETSTTESEKDTTQPSQESVPALTPEKPRPKRTRRGKNAEKEPQKPEEPPLQPQPQNKQPQPQNKEPQPQNKEPQPQKELQIALKEERISQPDSPVLQKKADKKIDKKGKIKDKKDETVTALDETRVISQNLNVTVTLNNDIDKTLDLANGVYNHVGQNERGNDTIVLEKCSRETMVLEKHNNINDATVVLEKDPKASLISDDNSLLTDDNSEQEVHTPPTHKQTAPAQPTSAVKEKVQQFEELAARTTRTKTRAMAKMEEQNTDTPPDKIIKPVLSQETLNKMNSIIFNGRQLKQPDNQVSSSASKPRANLPPMKTMPSSTSKLSSLTKHKEAAEERLKKEKEDARKKKEAMLEAKREMQKKKREEKMAAAAAAREAAEKERRAYIQAAAKERMEKQAHADQGKLERLKEVERKKHELARKVAETEERRRAEEQARQQRLAEEQKKADAARRKQIEEAEATKKEAAFMAKEIEKRQKEYLEKQRQKRLESGHTPLKSPGGYHTVEPVYMEDGFQHLHSDEDEEPAHIPPPPWCTSKARKITLAYQSQIDPSHIDKLFSVRIHSPDLREIFPNIDRSRLKRTSSAVWRTPPRLPTLNE